MYVAENGGAIIDTMKKVNKSILQKFHETSLLIFSANALYSSRSSMGMSDAGRTGDKSQGPPSIKKKRKIVRWRKNI